MGRENRTHDAIPWYETADLAASPPSRGWDTDDDWNYWQDNGVRMMALSGTITPTNVGFENIAGSLRCYGQSVECPDAATTEIFSVRNPHNYSLPPTGVESKPFNLLNRIILCTVWTESVANQLPDGIAYDPNTFNNAPVEHLWFTDTGADDTGAGVVWTPWANVLLFAASADGLSIKCKNGTGASIFMVMWPRFSQVIET